MLLKNIKKVFFILLFGSFLFSFGFKVSANILSEINSAESKAKVRNILFSRIGVKDGLTQGAVNSIVQDTQGYIWFGTQEGIIRYDGHEMVVYEHDFEQSGSLSSDWVWTLLVDSSGDLWVGTYGGGLNLFNREKGTFKHYKNDENDINSLVNNRVRVILQDRNDQLWIGTDNGLDVFNPETEEFIHYQHDPDKKNSLANNSILSLFEDISGNLWIGTNGGGLSKWDSELGTFTNFIHDPADPSSISSNKIRAIYEDNNGNLWIGTYDAGLDILNRLDNSFTHYPHNTADKSSISNNRIRNIFQDREGTLWVATDDGLNEWIPSLKKFNHYQNAPQNIDSISDNRISAIFQDRGGVLWVGTFNGVNKWNYVSDMFTYYQQTSTAVKLSSNIVTAVTEDNKGMVWVGTYGGGINKIDPISGAVVVLGDDSSNNNIFNDNRIMAIYIDKQQSIWVGTRNGGLNKLDPVSGVIQQFRHDPDDPNSISDNTISTITGDSDGTIWVGTYGGGLNKFDQHKGIFTVFKNDLKNDKSLSSDRVISIYRDSSGFLWVGTEDGGLNKLVESDSSFIRYIHNSEDTYSLSSNTVIDIIEGADKTLWIATGGGGLNQWLQADRIAGRTVFNKFRKGDILRSDTVQSIRIDDTGLLWLSSNKGLVQFDPNKNTGRFFDQSNGLKGNEFNSAVRLKSHSGELFFGGTSGLVSFKPKQLKFNYHKPDVSVLANTRLGALDSRNSILPDTSPIELGYQEDLITFKFSALDYASPDKNLFSYMLEGFDKEWSIPMRFNRTTYTSLPAGDYTFRVKAANNDGVWNEEGVRMKLRVIPPPWQTITAYVVYALSILAIIFLYIRTQKKKLEIEKKQRIELECQVALRTNALAEKNEDLNDANLLLKEASWTDSLTGLKNRRYLDEFIETEVAQVLRRTHEIEIDSNIDVTTFDITPSLSFMMIDLDGFKLINDTYGHHAGDEALIQVTSIIKRCCRKSDTIIRWGGDEFMIIGSGTAGKSVEKLAERIRKGLVDHQYQLGGGNIGRLSGSIGFALYPFSVLTPNEITWEQVAGIADRGAYAVKENGRNAWVGIKGAKNITSAECSQIKHNLDILVKNERVFITSSIKGALSLNEEERGKSVNR